MNYTWWEPKKRGIVTFFLIFISILRHRTAVMLGKACHLWTLTWKCIHRFFFFFFQVHCNCIFFNQLFTLIMTTYIHSDVKLALRLVHIYSTLYLVWPDDTVQNFAYTCNTSTTNIKDAHLTVPRQPAEAAKTGYQFTRNNISWSYMTSYKML